MELYRNVYMNRYRQIAVITPVKHLDGVVELLQLKGDVVFYETSTKEEVREINEEICEFDTIDNFCNNNSITNVDLLKIDVQGAEYKVLKGATQLLKSKKIKTLILEIIVASNYENLWKLSDYIEYFEKLDYELYGLYNFSYGVNNNLLQLDAIFISKNKNIL